MKRQKELTEECKKWKEETGKIQRARILEEYAECFRPVRDTGQVRNANKHNPADNHNKRSKRQERYFCYCCPTNKKSGQQFVSYSTSIEAMMRHAEAHKTGDFIFIAEIKSGQFKGAHRPEQHTHNEQSGRYWCGSDAKTVQIRIPADSKCEEGRLHCRVCDEFAVEYGEGL
eukprot:gene285-410_t